MPSSSKEQINAYGISLLSGKHKAIKQIKKHEDSPSIHGNKLWGSSFLLMDYFEQNPIPKRSKVMEIGCGWGPASIYCAKNYKAKVTAVDADAAVFPYLELQAEHNDVKIRTWKKRFEKITSKDLKNTDILIGSDICFWDELTPILFNLIRRAIKADVKKIVIADPERSPFLELADKCIAKYCAEVLDWETKKPKKTSGGLLIIENA